MIPLDGNCHSMWPASHSKDRGGKISWELSLPELISKGSWRTLSRSCHPSLHLCWEWEINWTREGTEEGIDHFRNNSAPPVYHPLLPPSETGLFDMPQSHRPWPIMENHKPPLRREATEDTLTEYLGQQKRKQERKWGHRLITGGHWTELTGHCALPSE